MPAPTTLDTVVKSPSLTDANAKSTPPVIVVGLPRSGSSYLTHVLSCLDNWFVFDDLYPYQKANSLGISSTFDFSQDLEKMQKFVNLLSWQLWAKVKFEQHFEFLELNLEDPFEMESAVLEAFRQHVVDSNSPVTWPTVLEEWMKRLAIHGGNENWGYKTPQDFIHMDELVDIFPGVKFIYIMRDPRTMMRSYKNLPRVKTNGKEDGESRQYHPVPYALYWKNAYEKVQRFIERGSAPVEVVKFEELVENPEAVAEKLAVFLGTHVAGRVVSETSNSSARAGTRKELSATEIFICEQLAGTCMKKAGYHLSDSTPRPMDMFDLFDTSVTFTMYQARRVATSKKARASVSAMIKSLFTAS